MPSFVRKSIWRVGRSDYSRRRENRTQRYGFPSVMALFTSLHLSLIHIFKPPNHLRGTKKPTYASSPRCGKRKFVSAQNALIPASLRRHYPDRFQGSDIRPLSLCGPPSGVLIDCRTKYMRIRIFCQALAKRERCGFLGLDI